MKVETPRRAIDVVFCISVGLHGVAVIQFLLMRSNLAVSSFFAWQFFTLLGFSLLLSVVIHFGEQGFLVPGVLKLGLLFFIGYPLEGYIGLELTLYIGLALEAATHLSTTLGLLFQAAALTVLIASQRAVSAFTLDLPPPTHYDLVSMSVYALLSAVGATVVNLLLRSREQAYRRNQRLDGAVRQLTNANLGYQSYASHLETDTLHAERKRVSREIHDGVGYSLTNILMMLEAAGDVLAESPLKASNLVTGSIEEARRCLDETRASMRELRSSEQREPVGIAAAARLTAFFAQATGVDVMAEYGNARPSYGEKIDATLVRILQEGMTNAFRHGMATQIRIQFWENREILNLRVQDNGYGAEDLTEGIGLAGMRERIQSLGGTLVAANGPGGFRIDAAIPIEARNKEGVS